MTSNPSIGLLLYGYGEFTFLICSSWIIFARIPEIMTSNPSIGFLFYRYGEYIFYLFKYNHLRLGSLGWDREFESKHREFWCGDLGSLISARETWFSCKWRLLVIKSSSNHEFESKHREFWCGDLGSLTPSIYLNQSLVPGRPDLVVNGGYL